MGVAAQTSSSKQAIFFKDEEKKRDVIRHPEILGHTTSLHHAHHPNPLQRVHK